MLTTHSGVLKILGSSLLAFGAISLSGTTVAQAEPVPATQPAEAAPATQPSAPVDPAVAALIDKLGDPDPAVREGATKKLSEIGKSVIPALKEAAESSDPELGSRARELIHHMQRRVPPAARPANAMRSQSVRSSMNGGLRTVDVNDNGQQIHIVHHPDESIEMSVAGIDADGRDATETYKAKDADELKQDNPEAFALYDKWVGNRMGQAGIQMQGGIQLHVFGQAGAAGGIMPLVPMGPGQIGGGHAGGAIIGVGPNGARPLPPELRARIEKQLRDANVPAEQRDQILKNLDDADKQDVEQRQHEHLQGKAEEAHPETQKSE